MAKPSSGLDENVGSVCKNWQWHLLPWGWLQPETSCLQRLPTKTSCPLLQFCTWKSTLRFQVVEWLIPLYQREKSPPHPGLSVCVSVFSSLPHCSCHIGHFQLSSPLILLCLVRKVCGVFTSRILSAWSDDNCCGCLQGFSKQQPVKRYLTPCTGILFVCF